MMNSRQQELKDLNHPEKFDLTNDYDLIYCPISLQIMRHPVRLSTGNYYELAYILESVKKRGFFCPKTRLPFTSFTLDAQLKNRLDAQFSNNDDRYDDYSAEPLENELKMLLKANNNIFSNRSYAMAKSIAAGCVIGTFTYMCVASVANAEEHFSTTIPASLFSALVTSMSDFVIRACDAPQFRFFEGLKKIRDELAEGQNNASPDLYIIATFAM